MARSRTAYHDIAFEVAARLEARQAHEPTVMRSGNSQGPIAMFVCDMPHCGEVKYSYVKPHATPVCSGGALFSFRTTAPFDANVHRGWLA